MGLIVIIFLVWLMYKCIQGIGLSTSDFLYYTFKRHDDDDTEKWDNIK